MTPRKRRFLGIPRTIAMVAGAVGLALFGSFLLLLTPSLESHPGLQTMSVIFSLVLLKFPLLFLVWWVLVQRRRRSPARAAWSERETTDFLERVSAATGNSLALHDPMPRLAQLRDETWRRARARVARTRGLNGAPGRVVVGPRPGISGRLAARVSTRGETWPPCPSSPPGGPSAKG
jgi:hypothetical protein